MSNTLQNARAGGTINTCRFVVPDVTHPNGAVQASVSTVLPLGISTDASRVRPDPDYTDAKVLEAADVGEVILIYPPGSVGVSLYCKGAWNPGDLLMSDTDGGGLVCTSGNYYGARAQSAGVVGALCPVDVISGLMH